MVFEKEICNTGAVPVKIQRLAVDVQLALCVVMFPSPRVRQIQRIMDGIKSSIHRCAHSKMGAM